MSTNHFLCCPGCKTYSPILTMTDLARNEAEAFLQALPQMSQILEIEREVYNKLGEFGFYVSFSYRYESVNDDCLYFYREHKDHGIVVVDEYQHELAANLYQSG